MTAVHRALCACALFWKSERAEFADAPLLIESIVIQASWDAAWKGAHADRDHEGNKNGGKNYGSDHLKINMENTASKSTARRQIFAQNDGNTKMEISQKLVDAAKPSFQEIFYRIQSSFQQLEKLARTGDPSPEQETVSRTGDKSTKTVDFRSPKGETNTKNRVLTMKESPGRFLVSIFEIYGSKYGGLRKKNLMSPWSIYSK